MLLTALRGSRSVQLGCGPGAHVLDGLGPADWRAITLLRRGLSRSALLEDARRTGVDEARRGDLVRLLDRAGALVTDRSCRPHDITGSRLRQEAAHWSRVRGSSSDPVGRRAAASVAVVGGGGLGAGLAAGFAASGVGTAALVEDALVRADDVLPGGPGAADIGRRSSHAGAEAVHRVAPQARTACPTEPDLVVLVAGGALDAGAAQELVQADTAHLPVLVREDDVVVGPLVHPGTSACLHCLDLHRCDVDPTWPDLLRQLIGHEQPAGDVPVPALGQVAVGVAVLLGLAHLDARAAPSGVAATVSLPYGAVRWGRWSPHPRCGCVGLPDPGSTPGATMAA